jgi:hypothetical protein
MIGAHKGPHVPESGGDLCPDLQVRWRCPRCGSEYLQPLGMDPGNCGECLVTDVEIVRLLPMETRYPTRSGGESP